METKLNKKIIGAAALVLGIGLATSAYGAVSGACSDCHTMHNSQDGAAVAAGGPYNQLLNVAGCGGCHAQGIANAGAADALTTYPQVTADTTGWAATKETELAGGFFDTTTGASASAMHNPSDLGTTIPTDTLTTPPGLGTGSIWTGAASGSLSCAGARGCHDTGGHHLNATGDNEATGASVATSYRFLKLATRGYEDGDYEFSSTTSDHNQYYGVAQTKGTAGTTTGTMSNLCAGCHEDFHTMTDITGDSTGGGGNWWLRHPNDFDMTALTGEYDNYTTYDVTVPVASDVVSAADTTIQDSLIGATAANDGIVMCLSCHRAHGSRHADLLRWDYSTILAGAGGTTGCLVCHNTK